jgi:hypothetical protein
LTSPSGGSSPWASATASSAALSASGLIGLYTVMYCSPARIRWIAASSASCPVVGLVAGLMPADFIAAIAPPAVPSFAAYTPANPLSPSAVIDCSISTCASSGDQSGVSYCFAISTPLSSNTPVEPSLNSFALLSVGAPLIWTMGPFGELSSASFLLSASPCWRPTSTLSNDT